MRAPAMVALALGLTLGACKANPPGHDHEGHPEHQAPGGHAEAPGTHGGDHEAHGGDEEDVVRLSAEAIARSGIRLEPVGVGRLERLTVVPAEVQLNPERVAHVSPLVGGQLREVNVSLGDRVEAGQTLAYLNSVQLGQDRAEYRRVRAMLKVAQANLSRQKRLRSDGISSERAYLEAQFRVTEARAERDAAHGRLEVFGVTGGVGSELELRAPISGIVTARHATQGENITPDTNLFVISDTSTVWVIGRVYEQQVAVLRPEMDATLTLSAYPGRTWKGTVSYTASLLDEETRSLAIRVELKNPDGELKPGLFGTLRIQSRAQGAAPVPLVAESALQDLRGQAVVFVGGREERSFVPVPVVTGLRSSGQVEILEGLAPDARVVIEGAFVLKSELLRGELGHGHAH